MEQRAERPSPASLRCLLVGGARLAPQTLERALAAGYPVALTYGLTEATSQVATAAPPHVREKPGTVGRPLSGIEVRIRRLEGASEESDPAGRREPAIPFEGNGEILVRGPTVAADPDEDGWLHTGDTGYLDGEGDLWVTGRASERIVTGGITVEPAEVERILAEHPSVRDVAVLGTRDSEWGERIVAAIVPEPGREPPTLAELLEFSRSRLAPAKRPRELRLLTSLPRNASGKVDRAGLRDLCS